MTPALFWEPLVPLDRQHGPVFIAESLPSPFREWAIQSAESFQVPVDLPAMLDLGLIGGAGAKKFQVLLPNGHREPVHPWVLVVMGSGERKSSLYLKAILPVHEWEAERIEAKRSEVWEYQTRVRTFEKALGKAEDQLAKTIGDWTSKEAQDVKHLSRELSNLRQSPVVTPRVIVDDITPEKLAVVLAEQGGRILISSPEGGTFDIMAGKYSKDNAPNLDLYLKGYMGEDHIVDRINREAKQVSKAHIAMVLATQPEILRGLEQRQGFRGRGVIARLWFSIPDGTAGFQKFDAAPIAESVRAKRRAALRALLDIPIPGEPYDLTFAEKAADHLIGLHRDVQLKMRPEGELSHVKDWASRAVGGMARLCGILHLMEHAENPRLWEVLISAAAALRAWSIMQDYLIPHALTAFTMMGKDSRVERAGDALGWIKRHRVDRFSRAELHKDLHRQVENPGDWDGPLQLLCDHNYIAAEETEPRNGPGRPPTPAYDVNPAVHQNGGIQ